MYNPRCGCDPESLVDLAAGLAVICCPLQQSQIMTELEETISFAATVI
jgi:hypothetical protein